MHFLTRFYRVFKSILQFALSKMTLTKLMWNLILKSYCAVNLEFNIVFSSESLVALLLLVCNKTAWASLTA